MAATYAAEHRRLTSRERAAAPYAAGSLGLHVTRGSRSLYRFRTSTSVLLMPAPFILPKIFASVVDIVPI